MDYEATILNRGLKVMCNSYSADYHEDDPARTVEALASALWVRPDKLERRALCAGWALKDLDAYL